MEDVMVLTKSLWYAHRVTLVLRDGCLVLVREDTRESSNPEETWFMEINCKP